MSTAAETIEAEVRELVRRRGLDPVGAPQDARALVDEVLADYVDRVPSSALPPIGDPHRVARTVLDAVAGFGPLQRWLDDPEVEEVWINEPGRVFVARRGRPELTTTVLTGDEVRELVSGCCAAAAGDSTSAFPSSTRCCPTAPACTR